RALCYKALRSSQIPRLTCRANKRETSKKQGPNKQRKEPQRSPKQAANKRETMQLTEQYRPREWSDVVGQDKVIAKIRALAKRGLAGRAYWLSGQSGTGKTTIARLIAADVASPLAIHEENARDIDVAYLDRMEFGWQSTVLAKPGEPI